MNIIIRFLGWLNSAYAYFLLYSYSGWLLNTRKYSVFTLQLNTEYNGLFGMQFSIQRILKYSFVSLAETPFPSIISLFPSIMSHFPRRKKHLNFQILKFKISHNSCLKAPRRLLMSFLDFKYFSCFWI